MIINLNKFAEEENISGNILAYKNPKGKNAALSEYIVNVCQSRGRLANNKLSIASSGRFAAEIAKVCRQKNIDFLPILGVYEDTASFNIIRSLGFDIDRTPAQEKESAVIRLTEQGWYYFDQFNDPIMVEYYKNEARTAESELGGAPDIFIDFMGSGATMRGFYETFAGKCDFGYSNSCYRDENKYARKIFIKDLITNNDIQLIDVQGTLAKHMAFRYEIGDFGDMGRISPTMFTSVQGAINWLKFNPGKTVLLYFEN